MTRNVLEYLENSGKEYAEKVAFDENKTTITYYDLIKQAKAVGTSICNLGVYNKPVVVYMPKSCASIVSFMGVVYSGGFYCPIDVTMPIEKIELIIDTLKPAAIITDEKYREKAEKINRQSEIIVFQESIETAIDENRLADIRSNSTENDPLYVLFTSGSTGMPKGVLISHRSIIDLVENAVPILNVSNADIWGNQGAFHFDLSVLEIYCSLKTGATVCIIPRKKFLFQVDLLRYLDEKGITVINWVPSALCNVANSKALDVVLPKSLNKVFFCGEAMPNKQLNIWRGKMPDVTYVNMYGPTEITYACSYQIVKQTYKDDEPLPIGVPFPNTKILVLNEKNERVACGEVGELCVAGSSLALGYYNNKKKTEEVFVNNPLNTAYSETIYRTGDLVKYNDNGELVYLSRKDFQIKHLGHRIELGEIEAAMGNVSGIENYACVYDENIKEICMCYTGEEKEKDFFKEHLKKKLTAYMIPQKYIYMSNIPYNANGKIDRVELKKIVEEMTGKNEI